MIANAVPRFGKRGYGEVVAKVAPRSGERGYEFVDLAISRCGELGGCKVTLFQLMVRQGQNLSSNVVDLQ